MPVSECTRTCDSLRRALQVVESESHPSYVTGGFVRDSLLGRPSRDIDIVVEGDPFAIAQSVARTVGGSFVPLNEHHCVARVILRSYEQTASSDRKLGHDDLTIDFTRYEGSIEDDLTRRDFTIDAIAVPTDVVGVNLSEQGTCAAAIITENAIDPLGGLQDLANRTVKAGGRDTFAHDPGRLLRAVRLARELSFSIETTTESLIRSNADLISRVAPERTREEFIRLLNLPLAADSVRYLDYLGLLMRIIPELETSRDVEQPTCHFWDVLEHSIQTVATFEFIAGQSDWRYGNDEVIECLPGEPAFQTYISGAVSSTASRSVLIKIGCLLHDIGKPHTKELDDSGRARFLGHSREGASLSRSILQRLRFSNHEIEYIETLVYNHLRPAQMSTEGPPTARAVYRFFRDTGDAGLGVLYLAMADYLACRGPLFMMSEWRNVCSLISYILQEHRRQEIAIAPTRLIDGRELMQELGIQPGPVVGRLLEAIREAQAAGLVGTREEALELSRRTIGSEHFTVRDSK